MIQTSNAPAAATLEALVKGGVSALKIAEIFDVHWSTVYRWIRLLPGYIHKSERLKERLTLLYRKGKTVPEMAAAVGHTETWVRERLHDWGLVPKAYTWVDQIAFDRLLKKGKTRQEIQVELGCSRTTYFRRKQMSKVTIKREAA